MVARSHRLAALRHHHRFWHLAQRIGGGVGTETAVVFHSRDRRVGKQFEIVVRQPPLLVDHGGALRLYADADARACKLCRRQAEEGGIRRVPETHHAGGKPAFGDGRHHHAEDSRQGVARRGLEQLHAEGRADTDHDIPAILRGRGCTQIAVADAAGLVLLVQGFRAQDFLLVQRVADAIDLKPPLFRNAIARARPQIVVGIVDGADDLAVAVYTTCISHGLIVGQEITLIGYGDTDIAAKLGISSVRTHLDATGRRAVEILRSMDMDGEPSSEELNVELIHRKSSL